MRKTSPMAELYIIAGPNGAGKSTFSHLFVPGDVIVFDRDKLLALREKQYPDIDRESLKEDIDFQFEDDKREALKHGRDFAYETNFPSATPPDDGARVPQGRDTGSI